MCQNLLAFLKNSCPLSVAFIVAFSASNVNLPCYVKLVTLFTLTSFFACVRTIGGMFSLLVFFWSCKLFCLL